MPGLLAGLVSARQSPGGALSGGIPPDVMRGGAGAGPPGGPGRSEIPAAACNGCRSAACLHAGAMAPAETVPAGTVPGITAPGMVPPSMVPPDIVPPIGGTILGGTVLGVTGCGAGYGRHGVWCRLWPARFRAADGRHGSGGPLSARPIGRAAGGMNRRSDRAGGRLSAGNCRRGRAAGAIAPAEGGGGVAGPCRGLAKDARGRPSDVQLLVVRHAAALYRACINNNEPKSQKNISIASGVTEVTIRNRCVGLRTLLE